MRIRMSFKGKVVIVTGSSSGIGQEAALIFGQEGACITIHGRNEERLKQAAEFFKQHGISESQILLVLGSIEEEKTQQNLINETLKKFGKLDVLVNNAGLSHRPDLDPNCIENLDYVMNANLRSVIALTRLAVPHLEKTKGNIVNISSIGAQKGSSTLQLYVLSKAALDHYTKNAAVQYAEKGIRVNTVSPGVTKTNFFHRNNIPQDVLDGFVEKAVNNMIPLHRLGECREVANVIEFLASDKASYVTGSNYVVDGGVLAGSPSPSQQL